MRPSRIINRSRLVHSLVNTLGYYNCSITYIYSFWHDTDAIYSDNIFDNIFECVRLDSRIKDPESKDYKLVLITSDYLLDLPCCWRSPIKFDTNDRSKCNEPRKLITVRDMILEKFELDHPSNYSGIDEMIVEWTWIKELLDTSGSFVRDLEI